MVVPPGSPCGCESGKTFGECHLRPDGVNVVPRDFNPPLPLTGKTTKKCYFAFTNNCDGRLSKEHIISKAVLKEISTPKIFLHSRGEVRQHSINSSGLTVRRLCQRHNSGFHRIDSEAGRFLRAIQKADQVLNEKPDRALRLYLFHGEDLERWLLKTLLNLYHSRLCVNPNQFHLPPGVATLFSGVIVPPPYGCYVKTADPSADVHSISIQKLLAFNLLIEGSYVVGVSVALSGVEFVFLIGGRAAFSSDFLALHTHRPRYLTFFEENHVVSLVLAGYKGSEQAVTLSLGQPNAALPEIVFSDFEE